MSADQYLPCGFCGGATPHSALATFGARCKPCFDAYCLERPKPPASPQGRQKAFMPQRPAMAAVDDVVLPPAVPVPSRSAAPAPSPAAPPNTPHRSPEPMADEPPSWATEEAA